VCGGETARSLDLKGLAGATDTGNLQREGVESRNGKDRQQYMIVVHKYKHWDLPPKKERKERGKKILSVRKGNARSTQCSSTGRTRRKPVAARGADHSRGKRSGKRAKDGPGIKIKTEEGDRSGKGKQGTGEKYHPHGNSETEGCAKRSCEVVAELRAELRNY